jgi:hypothetical protein
MLTCSAGCTFVASLLLACSPAVTKVAAAPARAADGYRTIRPDVSVSRTAEPTVVRSAALEERADVMAEILAIPPGR